MESLLLVLKGFLAYQIVGGMLGAIAVTLIIFAQIIVFLNIWKGFNK